MTGRLPLLAALAALLGCPAVTAPPDAGGDADAGAGDDAADAGSADGGNDASGDAGTGDTGAGDAGTGDAAQATAIACLSPAQALPGREGLTLFVTGERFTSASVVNWNGAARPTRFVSATDLEVALAPEDLVAPGSFDVTVSDPSSSVSPAAAFGVVAAAAGRRPLANPGLYVYFERRGWASEYNGGQVLQEWANNDSVVGHTVAEEVALQLDRIRSTRVNTITYELRATDDAWLGGSFEPPTCNLPPTLGLNYPQPHAADLDHLVAFLDLLQAKGFKLWLRLTNTHMEEDPPTKNQQWLGAILARIKDHAALDLVLFEGNTFLVDTDGDGAGDACGNPAEPPLWLGPDAKPARYVKWAIGYAHSLGMPYRKLSAEAIVGDYGVNLEGPAGPDATDQHLWKPVRTQKAIFDALSVPDAERTYALSMYENRRCAFARGAPCTDADPHAWADETLAGVWALAGRCGGARVLLAEFGDTTPLPDAWRTEWAVESLAVLMERHGVAGGSFWRWTNFNNGEDADAQVADAVKRRGTDYVYNPVRKELLDYAGLHLPGVPNGSFERDAEGDGAPDEWTISGNESGAAVRRRIADEPGQPEVPSRGSYALRLSTGPDATGVVQAASAPIGATAETEYTLTANMRFGWTADPDPGADAGARPHVFASIDYADAQGTAISVRPSDVFRWFQEDATSGFDTFPLRFTTPAGTAQVRVTFGVKRRGLASEIVADVDNVR